MKVEKGKDENIEDAEILEEQKNEDAVIKGLNPFSVMHKMTAFALIKMAAEYHRAYFKEELEILRKHVDKASKEGTKEQALQMGKALRLEEKTHKQMQNQLVHMHKTFEDLLSKTKGANATWNHYQSFMRDGVGRLFTIQQPDRLKCINLLDMFRSGDFKEAFEEIDKAYDQALEDAAKEAKTCSKCGRVREGRCVDAEYQPCAYITPKIGSNE